MPFQITCPSCRKTIKARDEYAGKRVKCPGCGVPFVVPAPAHVSAQSGAKAMERPADAPKLNPVPPPPPSSMQGERHIVGRPHTNVAKMEGHMWSGRPSQVVNLNTFVKLGLLAFVGLVFIFVIPGNIGIWRFLTAIAWPSLIGVVVGWRFLEIYCLRYELSDQRLRIHRGVLSRRIDDLELYRVKDTSFEQSLFLRLFDKATVLINTSDISTSTIRLWALPAEGAQNLREIIRENTERLRDKKRVREIDISS